MVKLSQLSVCCLLASLGPTMVAGQTFGTDPTDSRFVLVGYGDVKYEDVDARSNSVFSARFVPIFLFNLNDKMHVEAETEISINEAGETETELEYANMHYFLSDSVTLTAGKFLLPFGQFSANWHPSWINRSIWTPGVYGAHGSTQAMDPLLPILSDVGVAVQKNFNFGGTKVFLDLFVTNGPSAEAAHDDDAEDIAEDGHDDIPSIQALRTPEDEGAHDEGSPFPEVEFEARGNDNNDDKAFGGRVAIALLPTLELGTSYYRGAYDDDGELDITANGVDINLITNHFIVRGEYIKTTTEAFEIEEEARHLEQFDRNGWFVQGTFFLGHVLPSLGSTELVVERAETQKYAQATRWMVGANYWLDPRSVIKVGYEDTKLDNAEDDKRFAVQFSYGF